MLASALTGVGIGRASWAAIVAWSAKPAMSASSPMVRIFIDNQDERSRIGTATIVGVDTGPRLDVAGAAVRESPRIFQLAQQAGAVVHPGQDGSRPA